MGFNLADYEPVETRLARWWDNNPRGSVRTVLIQHGDGQWVFRAELYREGEELPCATGYAHEVETARGVNSTSAAENCETSALGRALANAGYAPKGARPSREEMQAANDAASQQHAHAERVKALAARVKADADVQAWVKRAAFAWPWTAETCDLIDAEFGTEPM